MSTRSPLSGCVYVPRLTNGGAVLLRRAEMPLDAVEVVGGQLVCPEVSVESRAVLVEVGPDGALRGVPMDPIDVVAGRLCFDPAGGGIRTRFNRLEAGAHNRQIAEATRFGMVNVLFHLGEIAGHINRLLAELGAPPLPPIHAAVGAHAGSKLPGYGANDADFRRNCHHPLQGAHYRVSTRTTGVPELMPVRPSGIRTSN